MAELTSYTGNAGLGLGSTPGIPAISPNDNLKVINDTSRDIMLLDSERNMRLYNQKIKDRDALTALILQNQVEPGNVEADYLPQFMEAKKKSEDAFQKWKGNPNDIEGFKNYQEAISHLQDYTAHARTNTTELQKLKQQRASETLPWKQKALDEWINQETDKTKKDPWQLVDPYQQAFNFKIDPIVALYRQGTATSTSPDGLWKYEDTYGDYDQTLKAAKNEYLNNGETSEDIRQFFQKVEEYDPLLKKKLIESVNGQLDKYNRERGLQKGQSGYADQIQLINGEDGKQYMITEKGAVDPTEFAAKYALAQQEKYVSRTPSFQKDIGTYRLGQGKLAYEWAKLNKVDIPKSWVYIDRWNTQKKQLTEQEQVGAQKYTDLVDKIGQDVSTGDGRIPTLDRVNMDFLPESRQFIGGITYDPSGKKMLGRVYPKMNFYDPNQRRFVDDKTINFDNYQTEVEKKKTKLPYPDWAKAKAKSKGYNVESFYDVKYFDPTGKELRSENDLSDDSSLPYSKAVYRKAVKDYGMTFNQFKKGLGKLKQLVVQFDGDNGTATPQTILEGSRFEQSQYGKKGFEGVYGGDEIEQGTGGDEF